MTLIKMYFVSVIRKLTAEVAEKTFGKVSLSSFGMPCSRLGGGS